MNTIRQGSKESLREYIAQFNKENPNIETIINTFRNGLHYDLDLCKELTKFPCKTFKGVLAKAWAHIRWDEDEEYKISMGLPIKSGQKFPNILNINDNRPFIP